MRASCCCAVRIVPGSRSCELVSSIVGGCRRTWERRASMSDFLNLGLRSARRFWASQNDGQDAMGMLGWRMSGSPNGLAGFDRSSLGGKLRR